MQRHLRDASSLASDKKMEHEISQEQMKALKALADVNLRVGEARAALAELEKIEASYLKEREEKAVARVDAVLSESKKILDEAKGNYAEVTELAKTAEGFSTRLVEAYSKLKETVELFEKKQEEWDKSIGIQEDDILNQRNMLKIERATLENAKKSLAEKEIALQSDRKKIDDERGMLERAIKRLKDGRI